MKKRLLSLSLTFILLTGTVFGINFSASAKKGYVARSISDLGVRFIEAFEGYFEYAYWDYEHYTIGYGTTCEKDEYPSGISEPAAHKLLLKVLPSYESGLNSYLKKNNIYVTQNQYDALMSFTYNFGAYVWTSRHPTIAQYLENGIEKYTDQQIAEAFGKWVNAGGKPLQGLIDRRAAEARFFCANDYPAYFEMYVIDNSTTIRKSASYSSTSYGTYDRGTLLNIIQKKYIGTTVWGQVSYKGNLRWIALNSAKYGNVETTSNTLIKTCLYSAENTASGISLNWKKVPGATGYKIYRKAEGNDEYALYKTITENSDTSFTDTAVKVSTQYSYKVSTYNAQKEEAQSGSVTITFVKSPTLKSLSKTADGFKISWSKQSTATGYYIMRRAETDSYYVKIGTTTSTSYTDTSAIGGIKYYYSIKSYNSDGISGMPSAKSGIFLSAVTITSSSNTKKSITIKWTSSRGAEKYYIYKNSKYYKAVTSTSFTDTDINTKNSYTYSVKAYCSAAASVLSNSFTTKIYTPPAISSLKSSSNGVIISWKAVSGVNKYQIYRKVEGSKSYTALKTVTTTSYTDTSAPSAKKCYYKIASYDDGNKESYKSSAKSTVYYGTTKFVSCNSTKKGIQISWQKISGAKSYSLYSYSGKKYTLIKTLTANSYIDTTVKANKSKNYSIRVNYDKGSSGYSAVYTAYRLKKPTLKITKSQNGLLLSWSKVKNATGVIIYRKEAGESSFKLYKTEKNYNKNTFDNTTVKKGKKYYYCIKVIRDTSTSLSSKTVSKKR